MYRSLTLNHLFIISCLCGLGLAGCAAFAAPAPTNPPPPPTRLPTSTPLEPPPTHIPLPTATPTPSAVDTAQPYTGVYRGLTSQDRMLELTVEDGGVRSILLDFEIPGCAAQNYSPMSSYFGETKGKIENDVLTLKEGNGLVLTGTFTSATEVAGTLEVKSFLCEGSAALTWSASTDFVPPVPTPSPELLALIPEMEIPEGLFQPESDASIVDQFETILASRGDWWLIRNFNSVFPLPLGWNTYETGQATVIRFSPSANAEPSVTVVLGGVGYIGDNRTSAEVMAEFDAQLKDVPSAVVLHKEMVNASQGYYFLSATTKAGNEQIYVMLFSEDAQGFFHQFTVITAPEDWDSYYPVAREMVARWTDLKLKPLGLLLPEKIPTPTP